MKRIIVVLLFALILTPGANAETVTVIENHSGRSFEFSSIQYKLNPGEEDNFTIKTLGFGIISFQHNPGEIINVTSFKLSMIKVECLSVYEFPSWNTTNKTTTFYLYDRTTVISGISKINYTYSVYIWENWREHDYCLNVSNPTNISIITYLLFEFDFYYTYTMTKNIVEPFAIDPCEFVFLLCALSGIIGAIGGFIYRPIYESCVNNPPPKTLNTLEGLDNFVTQNKGDGK